MSLIWMTIIGFVEGVVARLFMPRRGFGRLLVLGISGAIIAGVIQYAMGQPIGWLAPAVGACIMLVGYGMTAVRRRMRRPDHFSVHDDFRRAA